MLVERGPHALARGIGAAEGAACSVFINMRAIINSLYSREVIVCFAKQKKHTVIKSSKCLLLSFTP